MGGLGQHLQQCKQALKNQAAYRGVAVLAFLVNGPAVTVVVGGYGWEVLTWGMSHSYSQST